MAVTVKTCPLFWETYNKYKNNLKVVEAFNAFRKFKETNPIGKYGSTDYPFRNEILSGISHAHLTHNVSILYTVSGSNPHILKLIGFFSHDESGTGQPTSFKRQQQLRKRINQQIFNERKKYN